MPRSQPIDVNAYPLHLDLTEQQRAWFEAHADYLIAFDTDHNRLRVRYKDGRLSPWFSRLWPRLGFEHIAPGACK